MKSRTKRLQPDENWMTTEQAAEVLCVSQATMQTLPAGSIQRMVRTPGRVKAIGSGYLWYRPEVVATAELRTGAKLSLNSAVRVMSWVRDNQVSLATGFLQRLSASVEY